MTYGNYPDLKNVKKILVVKLRQLGDCLLTTPVFSALKKRLPEARIDAYVYTESFPLLEENPFIDTLIGYDRGWKRLSLVKRLYKEWTLLRKIRRQGYDLVINLTEGDRGAIAAWMAKAQVRVGFSPKGRWQKKLYTHVVKNCPSLRHTVERNLDALRRIGIFPEESERELFLDVKGAGPKVEGPFILIHPTSRWMFKCFPKEKMRALTQELIKRGEQVVFSSGPDKSEKAFVEEVIEGLNVVNLSGQMSLKELVSLVKAAKLLVCVDSLPFHIANALKKPVVAIFGPTSEITWGPWRNQWARVVSQNISCRPCYMDGCGGSKMSDCLATLPVDRVLKSILEAEIVAKVGASRLRVVDERLGCSR